jgi:hypothetical protein
LLGFAAEKWRVEEEFQRRETEQTFFTASQNIPERNPSTTYTGSLDLNPKRRLLP